MCNAFVDTVQTHCFLTIGGFSPKFLIHLVSAEGLEPSTP